MNRRTLLASVGAAASSGLLGCLADATGTDGPAENRGRDASARTDPSEYPVNDGLLERFEPETTYETVRLGSRAGVDDAFEPHDVRIWNPGAVPEVALRVTDATSGSEVHRETYEIPSRAELAVALLEPSVYLLKVGIPTEGTEQVLRVPCHFFDCNDSATRIGLFDAGEIRSSVASTLVFCTGACEPPR